MDQGAERQAGRQGPARRSGAARTAGRRRSPAALATEAPALEKLLKNEVKSRGRTNQAQAKHFADQLDAVLGRYEQRQITSAEVVQRLVELARSLREAGRRHEQRSGTRLSSPPGAAKWLSVAAFWLPAGRLRDTQPTMPEESTNLELVERARVGMEAFGRGDFDLALSFFARDAVWVMTGGETFEGIAAIRAFFEDFYGQFENFAVEHEEIRDLGGEVLLVVNTMRGHPLGSTVDVRQRGGFVIEGAAGFAERLTAYSDIDQARAVAERLAEEREVGGVG